MSESRISGGSARRFKPAADEIGQLATAAQTMAAMPQREANLKAQREELRALSNLSQALLATTDAEAILDSALRHALSDTSTTAGELLLAEPDREEISIRSATGLPAESSVSHRSVTFSFDLTRPSCLTVGKAP